jgi:hypothetical protein
VVLGDKLRHYDCNPALLAARALIHGTIPAWSSDFDSWAADALAHGDIGELAAYQTRAPGMPYAHPTRVVFS